MLHVALNPGLPGGSWAALGPLSGEHELRINDTASLLDTLLMDVPGTSVTPGKTRDLAICDCDRLMGAIYQREFGDDIKGTSICTVCNEPFDLSFSLSQLMQDLHASSYEKAKGPDESGTYTLSDGSRFRLPTVADQHAVAGMDPGQATAAIIERCVVEGAVQDESLLQQTMAEVGATADLDLDAGCPHCGGEQSVHFDIQRYLLRTLSDERKFLYREIHTLAVMYGWSHHEILSLSREERRTYVHLILAGRQASQAQTRVPLS